MLARDGLFETGLATSPDEHYEVFTNRQIVIGPIYRLSVELKINRARSPGAHQACGGDGRGGATIGHTGCNT